MHSKAYMLTLTLADRVISVRDYLVATDLSQPTSERGPRTLSYVLSEKSDTDGVVTESEAFDPAKLSTSGDAIFIVAPIDLGTGTPLARVVSVLSPNSSGEWGFNGPCAAEADDQLAAMERSLGLSADDLVATWLRSPRSSETGLREIDEVLATVLAADQQAQAASDWFAQDPSIRSLAPADVPNELRSTLDVKGVFVSVSGLPKEGIVWTATETGVSQGIRVENLPALLPAYFTPSDERISVQWSSSAERLDLKQIATFDATDSSVYGFEVAGSVDAPSVSVLKPEVIVDLLGLGSIDQLDEFKSGLLGVAPLVSDG
ncbi:MAG: hypothetical protein NTZ21_17315 [Actinobacteria bacterium]|nr:hypothetical protein [Actinomycetota bacterium]